MLIEKDREILRAIIDVYVEDGTPVSSRRVHDAGCQHSLHHRQRCHGQRANVEKPPAGGDGHPDREPARAPQRGRSPQRTANVHGRRRAHAAVLVEKADVRRQGAAQREQNAYG